MMQYCISKNTERQYTLGCPEENLFFEFWEEKSR